jgi:acetyl esterase/lipase
MHLVIYVGLTYAEIPGFRPLLLDLHVPDDAVDRAGAPVVVWVHGGGFASGGRRYLPQTLEPNSVFSALTKAGLACATADYRLLKEARWPAQRDDIAAAISFIRALCTASAFTRRSRRRASSPPARSCRAQIIASRDTATCPV